tara:strand:- start:271 stop:1245 length:975 start_codon:yes stop_codon:yes gene_type:complete
MKCDLKVFFLFAGLVFSSNVFAHSAADGNNEQLQTLVNQSDAIFYGEVKEVLYRMSETTKRSPRGVPHTFVKYQILAGIRGAVSRELTLRFVGGTDGKGGVLLQDDVPTFRKGERDVLLIIGGELDDCPLVSCVDGRFRVLDGRVYNGWGVPVVSIEKKIEMRGKPRYDVNVLEYPTPKFEDLITRPEIQERLKTLMATMSLEQIKREYEANAPKTIKVTYGLSDSGDQRLDNPGRNQSISTSENRPETRAAIPVSELISALRAASRKAGKPRNKVVSVNPNKRFAPYEWELAIAPDIDDKPRTPTAEEDAEQKSMLEGDDLEN